MRRERAEPRRLHVDNVGGTCARQGRLRTHDTASIVRRGQCKYKVNGQRTNGAHVGRATRQQGRRRVVARGRRRLQLAGQRGLHCSHGRLRARPHRHCSSLVGQHQLRSRHQRQCTNQILIFFKFIFIFF